MCKTQLSNNTKIYFLALITFTFTSSTSPQKNILSHNQMVDIIVDLELAKSLALYQSISTSKSKNIYENNVLIIYNKYAISNEIFMESYKFYANNPAKLLSIYDDVIKQLESLI